METIYENNFEMNDVINKELEYTKNLVEECISILCYCCSFSFECIIKDTNSDIVFDYLEQIIKEKPESNRRYYNATQLEKIVEGIKKYEDETFDIENPNLMQCLYKCTKNNKKIYIPFLEIVGREVADIYWDNEKIKEIDYIINQRYVLK